MCMDWFHGNNSQIFVLVLKPMLHMEPVVWSLGKEDGPLEGKYISPPGELPTLPHRVMGFTACGKKVGEFLQWMND